MPLAERAIKLEDEISRLEKEAEKLTKEVDRVESKLKQRKICQQSPSGCNRRGKQKRDRIPRKTGGR